MGIDSILNHMHNKHPSKYLALGLAGFAASIYVMAVPMNRDIGTVPEAPSPPSLVAQADSLENVLGTNMTLGEVTEETFAYRRKIEQEVSDITSSPEYASQVTAHEEDLMQHRNEVRAYRNISAIYGYGLASSLAFSLAASIIGGAGVASRHGDRRKAKKQTA